MTFCLVRPWQMTKTINIKCLLHKKPSQYELAGLDWGVEEWLDGKVLTSVLLNYTSRAVSTGAESAESVNRSQSGCFVSRCTVLLSAYIKISFMVMYV